MKINTKLGMLVGGGLVLLCTILGWQMLQCGRTQETAAADQPVLTTGETINTSDNGNWLAEYESDGVNGAGGVPAMHLSLEKVALPALLLILTGVFVAGIETRRAKLSDGR
jgi:hypothetical protein